MFRLPSPVRLNIDHQEADDALEQFNKLYADRDTRFPEPTQRINLRKRLDTLSSDASDAGMTWLNLEVNDTNVRITPGDILKLALKALSGETNLSQPVSPGEMQTYLELRSLANAKQK